MSRQTETERTAYCHTRAAECARAAMEKTMAELKDAYINLEQGWLLLAPELGDDRKPQPGVEPTERPPGTMPARSRNRSARHRR